MKKTIKLFASAAIGIITSSCSHQFQTVADGKVFRIGNASCNLLYVDGILVSTQVRENASAEVETSDDDEAGATASIKAKGVRKVVFRQGPIVSGYLQELAETSPEAAKAYVEKFPDITKEVFERSPSQTEKHSVINDEYDNSPEEKNTEEENKEAQRIVDELKQLSQDR